MIETLFHAYYTAMKLNMLQDEDALLSVFAEGKIDVTPIRFAAVLCAIPTKRA